MQPSVSVMFKQKVMQPVVCQFWNTSSCWISWRPDLASSSYIVRKQNTDDRNPPLHWGAQFSFRVYTKVQRSVRSSTTGEAQSWRLEESFLTSEHSVQGKAFPPQQEKLQQKKGASSKKVYIQVYLSIYTHVYIYVYIYTCVHTHTLCYISGFKTLINRVDRRKLPANITCSTYWSYWQYLLTNNCIYSLT